MAGTEPGAATEAPPSVIASHIDVIYRVYGAKRIGTVSGVPEGNRLTRLVRGRGTSVGAVREVHAVKDVSFVARHGESIGIIGRNGSGKSTLLRAVAGLIPPTHGQVYVSGQPSLLGVNAVLMRELSGERNVMIGAQALGLSAREVRERMDDIVEFSGVGDFIHLPMKAYSSGMAARLRFAISTAAVPDILMVDEALATGDADFRARSQERINEIREHAGTVFLVSHSDSTIQQICDRALWMERGELIMDGPAEEVVGAYREQRQKWAKSKKKPSKKPAPKPKGEETPEKAPKPQAEKAPEKSPPDAGTQPDSEKKPQASAKPDSEQSRDSKPGA